MNALQVRFTLEQQREELQAKTGLSRQALLDQLAHELPTAVDHITPQGRLPTDEELAAPGLAAS